MKAVTASIIIPAYNTEKYIRETLECVVAQTYPYWECIVIDDGSSDKTCEIVQEFINLDDRIKLIKADHGGVSAARNIGISVAGGVKYSFGIAMTLLSRKRSNNVYILRKRMVVSLYFMAMQIM